jgi:hypothetical protein
MRIPALASLIAPAALAALSACSPSFAGPEHVTGLRILAVQAEPPEIGAAADGSGPSWPAPTASLRTLVGHPAMATDGAPHAVVLHLGCTPAPGDVAGTACTSMSELSQPADLLRFVVADDACAAPGRGTVNGITFSGLEACSRDGCQPLSVLLDPADPGSALALPSPAYLLPDGFTLAALPAGHTQRVLGLDVVDVALALEASPGDVAPPVAVPDACAALGAVLQRFGDEWPLRHNLAALKWLHVRGPDMPADSPPNQNPSLSGVSLAGAPLPAPGGTPAAVVAGHAQDLLPVLPGDFEALRQTYQRFDTNARYVDTRQEDWTYSWFATAGDLDQSHTYAWNVANALTPGSGRAVIWLVVRDLRGGVAWTAGEVEAPPP